jgi:hypothetical protein
MDIWYPAQTSSIDRPLLFNDLLSLLEKRANYYTASTAGNGLTGQVAKSFAEGFGCSDSIKILQFKTASYENAPPAKGMFPLIVYLASYNSMAYENTRLFEDLAQKGYVATKLQNAACVVSLDGSEFHHYGDESQENDDFNDIVNSPAFQTMHLSLPYLRLESAPVSNSKKDSVYNFAQKLSTNNQVFIVNAATHQDFSYLPVLANVSGGCKSKEVYKTITAMTVSFLEDNVSKKKAFSGVLRKELNRTLKRK